MKRKYSIMVLFALLLAILPGMVLATCNFNDPSTPPLLPTILSGGLTINSLPAPIGTEIVAKIDNDIRSTSNWTVTAIGIYSPKYPIEIYGQKILIVGCYGDDGKPVDIYARLPNTAEYIRATQNLTWHAGQVIDNFDLTATSGVLSIPSSEFDPYVGEAVIIEDTITSPVSIDENNADGRVTYLYSGWVLQNKAGGILQQSEGLTQIHNNTILVTVAVPNGFPTAGTYELVSTIQYVQMDFRTGAWSITNSGTAIKQTKDIPVFYPDVPQSLLIQIAGVLQNLWIMFLALLGY